MKVWKMNLLFNFGDFQVPSKVLGSTLFLMFFFFSKVQFDRPETPEFAFPSIPSPCFGDLSSPSIHVITPESLTAKQPQVMKVI